MSGRSRRLPLLVVALATLVTTVAFVACNGDTGATSHVATAAPTPAR